MVKYLFCLHLDYIKEKAKAITIIFYWNILLYLKADILKEFKKLYMQFKIRIIFIIKVISISVNLPDIYWVVIY